MSVAPASRLTRLTPGRSASPATVNTPRAGVALDADAKIRAGQHGGHGRHAAPCGGRPARSISRLYSASESVTGARSLIRARRLLREGGVRHVRSSAASASFVESPVMALASGLPSLA